MGFEYQLTVVPPVGHRRHSHAVLERPTSVLFKDLQRHETAVTPTPNRHPSFIDVVLARPDLGTLDLVSRFILAQFATDDAPGLASNMSRSTAIDGDDKVAQARGNVGLEVDGELAVDCLRARTTVEEEQNGVFLFRVEVRRSALDGLEGIAVDGDIGIYLGWKGVVLHQVCDPVVFFNDCFGFHLVSMCVDDGLPRDRRAFESEQGVSRAFRKGNVKVARLRGIRHRTKISSVDLDLVYMTLRRRFFGCHEVYDIPLQVNRRGR